jgi:hypothetical protein
MPGRGAGPAHFVLLPVFGVVIHDLAHQLLDHGLAAGGILPVGQFRYRFGDGGNDFIGIDRVRLFAGDGILGKKAVEKSCRSRRRSGNAGTAVPRLHFDRLTWPLIRFVVGERKPIAPALS